MTGVAVTPTPMHTMRAALPYVVQSLSWTPLVVTGVLTCALVVLASADGARDDGTAVALVSLVAAALLAGAALAPRDRSAVTLAALPFSGRSLRLLRLALPLVLACSLALIAVSVGQVPELADGVLALTVAVVALEATLGLRLEIVPAVVPLTWVAADLVGIGSSGILGVWREDAWLVLGVCSVVVVVVLVRGRWSR